MVDLTTIISIFYFRLKEEEDVVLEKLVEGRDEMRKIVEEVR